jgi:hypothetical protein
VDRHAVELTSDLVGIRVVRTDDAKAALLESAVAGERRADLSCTDDDDAPVALEAENLAEPGGELGYRIAESAFTERAEE